jgi:hypothetical protein
MNEFPSSGSVRLGQPDGLETGRIRAHIRSMSIASVIFLTAKISKGDWQIVCHCPGGKIEYVTGFSDEQSTKNWRMSGYRAAWLKSSDRGRNPPGTPYIRPASDRSGTGLFFRLWNSKTLAALIDENSERRQSRGVEPPGHRLGPCRRQSPPRTARRDGLAWQPSRYL